MAYPILKLPSISQLSVSRVEESRLLQECDALIALARAGRMSGTEAEEHLVHCVLQARRKTTAPPRDAQAMA